MTALDTRRQRAAKQEPITTLGENPAFQALAEKLNPASELPDQPVLEKIKRSRRAKSRTDSGAEQPPPPQEVVTSPEREPIRSHAEAVMAGRPDFPPVPDSWVTVETTPVGIRLNKRLDGQAVALQFANDRPPAPEEKPIIQALGGLDGDQFVYDVRQKQWTRYGDEPHANLADAKRVMGDLVVGREGLGR